MQFFLSTETGNSFLSPLIYIAMFRSRWIRAACPFFSLSQPHISSVAFSHISIIFLSLSLLVVRKVNKNGPNGARKQG